MSAKLTIVFFILICFEIGILLLILPWTPYPQWNDNYLLAMASDHLHWPGLAVFVKNGFVRGAVSGLGVLNILLGFWEIVNFKKTARAFQTEWRGEQTSGSSITTADLRDNRSDQTGTEPPTGPAS